MEKENVRSRYRLFDIENQKGTFVAPPSNHCQISLLTRIKSFLGILFFVENDRNFERGFTKLCGEDNRTRRTIKFSFSYEKFIPFICTHTKKRCSLINISYRIKIIYFESFPTFTATFQNKDRFNQVRFLISTIEPVPRIIEVVCKACSTRNYRCIGYPFKDLPVASIKLRMRLRVEDAITLNVVT